MTNTINIPRYLTSVEFYNSLLKQVNIMKQYHRSANPIIFDFSDTVKIEPLVIPNLLCLGRMINGETGTRIVIRIPETLEAEKLKFYMDQIGFLKIAYNNIFDFDKSPYNGMAGNSIDPLCGSLHFSKDLVRSEIVNGINSYIAPFTDEYLKKYIEFSKEEDVYVNKVDHFIYEIIDNCCIHGASDSFLTIHARYSDRKIYISISDLGIGFLNSWNNRQKDKIDLQTEKDILNGNPPVNNLQAIICGVYKRRLSKIYGLYNIALQTLGLNGKIRIHCDDTQVLLTPRLIDYLRCENILQNDSFSQWNVKRNLIFRGSHIEMEVPF